MNKIQTATYRLAQACDGNPVSSTVVVMLFFVMFNFVEAGVEIALFGKRFEHALDAVFALAFMAYSAYAVYWCAVFNSTKNPAHNDKGVGLDAAGGQSHTTDGFCQE